MGHPSGIYAAVRLGFLDASGFDLWSTLIGARLPGDPLPFCRATTLAAATSEIHGTILRRLRDELRAATRPLIAREQALLDALHDRSGRLAAPLVQPGLFDRRALRDAEAQQRIAAEAAATAADRLVALRRLMDPVIDRPQLVFVLGVRRDRRG